MGKAILAVLVLGCGALAFGSTQASAGHGFRPADPARPLFCWRGPRWDYAAAYYQSYRVRRGYARRACGCRR